MKVFIYSLATRVSSSSQWSPHWAPYRPFSYFREWQCWSKSSAPMELISFSYRMDVFTSIQSFFLFVLLYRHSFLSSFLHPSFLFLLVDDTILFMVSWYPPKEERSAEKEVKTSQSVFLLTPLSKWNLQESLWMWGTVGSSRGCSCVANKGTLALSWG